MTEIATRQPTTGLALSPDQVAWNDQQLSVLRHMGVEGASEGDLAVFFHVAKRTGLDPFARQIHMIGRNSKNQRTDQWETKYTIQTGIDGYRLIGHRAARQAGVEVSLSAPEWAREDGQWVPLWSPKWGLPIAARVTVYRGEKPFPAVALFDEYKQTKRDGKLTSMWAQRPAGQLAKCAEALAWRMAFPQDLAGLYVEEEMHQADNPPAEQEPVVNLTAFTEPAPDPAPSPLDEFTEQGHEPITGPQMRLLHKLLNDAGLGDRDEGLAYLSDVLGRDVGTSKSLSRDEASTVIDRLQETATDTLPVDAS